MLTLYTAFRVTKQFAIQVDVESAGGAGIGNALGLAGFTNVDVVRNPTLGPTPYLARAILHWTVPVGDQAASTATPERYLDFRVGKMGTVDSFDVNEVGSDSHWQFLNWTNVNNGAYDYAADTRGYSYGAIVEFHDRLGVLRFGEMLMPKVANGLTIDFDVARARAENVELEVRPALWRKRPTVLRPLAYVNHANMGKYREAIDDYLAGNGSRPDITAAREQGRIKYGFGLNIEQPLSELWRAYSRFGWNDGRNESFAYTEVDRTAQVGTDVTGKFWHRREDKVGVAFVDNGISGDHRRYLELGGLGFLLGDGALRYGQERIVEFYYTVHVYHGVGWAVDLQHINNPGYNEDRGPVWVTSVRLHLEGGWNRQ